MALLRTFGCNRSEIFSPLTTSSSISSAPVYYVFTSHNAVLPATTCFTCANKPVMGSLSLSCASLPEISRDQMTEAVADKKRPAQDIAVARADAPADMAAVPVGKGKVDGSPKKKKNFIQSLINFIYNPRRKTVLGRSSLNWAKLATFYTVFYFCLGSFFVGLLYLFALFTDADEPRYYNQDSTMAVRTTATVVGMGFRPQPEIGDNLIRVSSDNDHQQKTASSLHLYRHVYLTQKHDAKTEVCSASNPSWDLPPGVACEFDWSDIVKTSDHPCSEKNLYGFKQEQPCVLVKLNKVFGWKPSNGRLPSHIQQLRRVQSDKPVVDSDVYITCEGTNPTDKDVLSDVVYYSMGSPTGSAAYGTIPNYFFPYRNAKDHVQPFVLVQFKKLPTNRLIGVTCRAWAPNMRQDVKMNRGLINFQLYRSHMNAGKHDHEDH